VAHVELSISEAFVSPATSSLDQESDGFTDAEHRIDPDGFARWSDTVSTAAEPCLLIDRSTIIAAVSSSCCRLLGLGTPLHAIGRALLDSELRLLDFTAARGELTEQDVEKIPPLLALASGRLARGLLRVRCGAEGSDSTFDAITTPILAHGAVAGSLTFFAEV
jgi:hypothetical protein